MNRFALIAVTGVFALTLSACGEQAHKPTVVTPEHEVVQPQPAEPVQPATTAPEQHSTEGQNQ